MQTRVKKSLRPWAILGFCFMPLFILATPASSYETYVFERVWPTSQQQWYFNEPHGVAIDSSGDVYVADTGNHRIQKLTSEGSFVLEWGNEGPGDGEFVEPHGIAIDSSGYVYVADSGNNRIQKFAPDGTFVTTWGSQGTGEGGFDYPEGIAVDSSGYVYVADTFNGLIQKFTSEGSFIAEWEIMGAYGFPGLPYGIAIDSSDYVYVADSGNHRIQVFTSEGSFVAAWGSGLSGIGEGEFDGPRGIAVDSSGYVYVADTANHRIQKFAPDETFVTTWGSQGTGEGEFDYPGGIAVDSSGYVYVVDSGNNRIQVFSLVIVNPPDKPTLSLPADGATNVSLTPTLRTGPFSDPDQGDTHLKTEWDISTEADFSVTVLQRTSDTHLTSLPLPQFVLLVGTTYYWRARFYDSHYNASEWSDPFSFMIQTATTDLNANGIPDAQENDTADMNNDGTPDIAQDHIKSLNTVVGGGQMGVSRAGDPAVTDIEAIDSIDPETISEIALPSLMDLGLFAMRLSVANAGEIVEVVIYFSEAAPSGATWLKYDPISGWIDYADHATFSNDRKSVVLELKDGDYGDVDGAANGIIVDPGGVGLASWVEGLITDASTGHGIARAEVTISELAFTADLTGHYLSMILPGTYQMTISAPGYEPFVDSGAEVIEGETLTRDVALDPLSQVTNLYFPHIDTTSPWGTEIALINTSDDQGLNGELKAYDNNGQLIDTMGISLEPHGRRQISVGDEFTNPTSIGYLVFEAGSDTVCGYTKFYTQGTYRVAVPAVKEVNTSDIYISHIDSSAEWWTGVSLLNTTDSEKTLSIDFDTGQSTTLTLAANEHQAFTIAGLFDGQLQPDINSAVITNASGIVGLELFGSAGGGNQLSGILIKDDTANALYYPHTASDETWWTGIVAFNPSSSSSTLTITPYTEEGASLATQTLDIPAGGKYIGTVSGLSLPPGTAWLKIDSTSAITGFELFGTTNGNQLAGYTGVGISGKEGVFAKIEKNDGWTGIAFVNIEGTAASVTLTAYDNYGNAVATQALSLGSYAKVVDLAENIFDQDISAATYIGYSSDREIVGFQLNGSSDDMMLDGLPGM